MLLIREAELHAMCRHAEAEYPNECCGALLGGSDGEQRTVRSVMQCDNAVSERQRDRYSIDPKELVRIQRQARESGQEIVGFYHSHPDCEAQWSQTDLAEAHWIGCSYVIVSVGLGRAGETRSFVLTGSVEEDKKFVEEELKSVADEIPV